MLESALIGLGSNLGDRAGALRKAVERLGEAQGMRVERVSTFRETEPVGEPGDGPLGGPYLNGALLALTELGPRAVLDLCLSIEAELGRVRAGRNAPRTLDLDLLLYGDRVIEEAGLVVPHPRLLERGFVLEPAAEIAPARRHPLTRRTLSQHWEEWRRAHDRHA